MTDYDINYSMPVQMKTIHHLNREEAVQLVDNIADDITSLEDIIYWLYEHGWELCREQSLLDAFSLVRKKC